MLGLGFDERYHDPRSRRRSTRRHQEMLRERCTDQLQQIGQRGQS